MATFKLNKAVKGKKFEYTVTNEKGKIISKRSSTCDYVACTANGEFYFGRLDLIGKGDHGKLLNKANLILSNPQKAWDNDAKKYHIFPNTWKTENPFEEWLKRSTDWAQRRKSELNSIAYL